MDGLFGGAGRIRTYTALSTISTFQQKNEATPCAPPTTIKLFVIELPPSSFIKLAIARIVCIRVRKSDTTSTGTAAQRATLNIVTN